MQTNKKILFVCNDAVPYGSGIALLNLIDALMQKNYNIHVLLPKHGAIEKDLKKRNINYQIFKYYSWAVSDCKFYHLKFFVKHILNLFSLIKLKGYINNQNFDIIHSMNSCVYFGSLIAKKYKIRHIWHLREYNIQYASLSYLRKKFNETNTIICVSNIVYNKFSQIAPNSNYITVYDGLDTSIYHNVKLPSVKKNTFNLLIAGDITENKGQNIAIKAVEYLISEKKYNLKLYIAGTGKDKEKLEQYVIKKNLENNIFFLGYRNDLNEIRKKTNIYLMCSEKEAWGFVTIESLLSKNLVIASNTGGSIEIINNKENGLLFNCGSWKNLATKIEYAILNWSECKKIINRGYNKAFIDYDINKTISIIDSIYLNERKGEICEK